MNYLFALLVLCSSFGFSQATPSVTNVQFLPDVLGVEASDIRFPLLSPDGNTLFYERDDSLCFFRFNTDTSSLPCYPYPETFGRLGRYSAPVWSPDSKQVVFTESFFDMFRDSDIWQLDAATGDYTNLTDDGDVHFNISSDTPDPKLLIDYLPTFSPKGELYFFRSRLTDGINEVLGTRFSLELFKFTEAGEAVRVSSLRPQLPVLSVSQPAAISPDGTQIAFIVLPPDFRENTASGVWAQDLATGHRDLVLRLSDVPQTSPEWLSSDYSALPTRLSWTTNNELLISLETPLTQKLGTNTLTLDVMSKTVTPLEDFSLVSQKAFDTSDNLENPLSQVPRAGFVLPEAKTYMYLGSSPDDKTFYLWSRTLPFTASQRSLERTFPANVVSSGETEATLIPGAFDTPPTVSSDGQRVLILGYLLTLE
jgi:hypothetical protein